MKKSLIPIAASLMYLLSSCGPEPETIGANPNNRQYKSIPSKALLELVEGDRSDMNAYVQKFRNSYHLNTETNESTSNSAYLDSAIMDLDKFVEKLSDIGIRYDSLEYQPAQKHNLEENLVDAHNKLIDISLDAFLQGAPEGSELKFVALGDGNNIRTVDGTLIKEYSGKDRQGNYAVVSGSLDEFEVFKDARVYLDNKDNTLNSLYGSKLDTKWD